LIHINVQQKKPNYTACMYKKKPNYLDITYEKNHAFSFE
jgi:hypothetical protein